MVHSSWLYVSIVAGSATGSSSFLSSCGLSFMNIKFNWMCVHSDSLSSLAAAFEQSISTLLVTSLRRFNSTLEKMCGAVGVQADTGGSGRPVTLVPWNVLCTWQGESVLSLIPQALYCLLKKRVSPCFAAHTMICGKTSGSQLKSGSGCAEDTGRTHCIFGWRWHEYLLRVISFFVLQPMCLPV